MTHDQERTDGVFLIQQRWAPGRAIPVSHTMIMQAKEDIQTLLAEFAKSQERVKCYYTGSVLLKDNDHSEVSICSRCAAELNRQNIELESDASDLRARVESLEEQAAIDRDFIGQYQRQVAELQAKVTHNEDLLKRFADNTAHTDRLARNAAKKVLSEDEVVGDSYGVPTLANVVELLVSKVEALEAGRKCADAVQRYVEEEGCGCLTEAVHQKSFTCHAHVALAEAKARGLI